MTAAYSEKLFSYGTLQQEAVQLANFGRRLKGTPDAVLGYKLTQILITDDAVIATSGISVHRILVPGTPLDSVEGVVLELTPEELQAADDYETDDYQRVRVKLRSGTEAWVYVAAEA